MLSLVGVVTAVTSASVAAVESTMNDVIVSILLKLPVVPLTAIIQSE